MKTLGVIIPAHNEQKNISKTIDEIKKLKLRNFVLNILVIDDGSIDKTFDEILKIKKLNLLDFLKILEKKNPP